MNTDIAAQWGAQLTALGPLAFFMAVASITPGPNNVMLATAGAVAGLRASVPHILGISVGVTVQIALIGIGLGSLFSTHPWLADSLRMASVGYLLWLAWSLVTASPPEEDATTAKAPGVYARLDNAGKPQRGRPLSFLGAALFQWVNPKAWMMALTVCAAFLPAGEDRLTALVSVAAVSMLVNLPCVTVWAGAGVALRRWLNAPARWRAFNLTMAVALVATAAGVL
ncbi:LysE family translocator [Candidatus Accumulibacter phosphatis]|uniref:Transporter, LysE family n=1 Tax=Candidatus Accumulibacter phosphatis TaxID=327160 RepID=A0A5S4EKR7_9PROT|nr:LysE family translocator [Candidatus Accumulibacter phosphatis]TMQ75957.1 Transporter, LysE family [Candidatus Accumulibacter phosphatis]